MDVGVYTTVRMQIQAHNTCNCGLYNSPFVVFYLSLNSYSKLHVDEQRRSWDRGSSHGRYER